MVILIKEMQNNPTEYNKKYSIILMAKNKVV